MKRKMLPLLSCALLIALTIADVYAGEQLKCVKRSDPPRSKIRVEVEDLKVGALYTAIVTSGIKSRTSSRAANGLRVAEFHFDSNKKDVLAGATKIGRKFISSDVDVLVTDAMGNVLVDKSVACRLK